MELDFAREALDEKLSEAGFEAKRPTFWIWEGVTMYLEPAAVRGTLGLISSLSPPGSLLTFDVWCPPQSGLLKLAAGDLPALAMKLIYSEAFTWGPSLEAIAPLLREEGLALIERVQADELVSSYTARRPSRLQLPTGMVLCTGEVEREL